MKLKEQLCFALLSLIPISLLSAEDAAISFVSQEQGAAKESNLLSYSSKDSSKMPSSSAQNTNVKPASKRFSSFSLPTCENRASRSWLSAQHRESKGIGYNVGYSTLEAFLGQPFDEKSLAFLDLRGHLFNDGRWAANAGIGLRKALDFHPCVIGINAYYDYREAEHHHFNQVGGGVELLGSRWDLRLNGYVPLGERSHKFKDGFSKFKDHRAIFSKRYEFTFYGGDAELGWEFAKGDSWDLHATLGGYYFYGKFDKHTAGGLLKLTSRLTPYLTLEAQGSYDHLFRWIGQGAVALNLPFGGRAVSKEATHCESPLSIGERLVEPVSRFEIIVKDNHRKTAIATDPVTGEPLFFIFVDNELGSSDGSFAHPYATLLEAQTNSSAGDVIYVFAGDGTTTGMAAGIVLKNNQQFLGSGVVHTLRTSFGLRDIPAQTALLPSITRTGGATVTLADDNIVRGFNIAGDSDGISGTTILSGTFADNNITATGNSILLTTTGTGTFVVNNNTLNGFTGDGITFTPSSSADYTLIIQDNRISTATLTSHGLEINLNDFSQGNAFIRNNTIAVPNLGMSLGLSDSSTSMIFIDNNTITDSTIGISAECTLNTIGNIRIFANSIINSADQGISFECGDDSLITIDAQKNSIVNANIGGGGGLGAFHLTAGGNVNVALRLFNNSAYSNNNTVIGFLIEETGAASAINAQSPDLSLSGIANLNIGSNVGANSATKIGAVETTGTITYTDLFLFLQSP